MPAEWAMKRAQALVDLGWNANIFLMAEVIQQGLPDYESRVASWIRSRIGDASLNRRERAMRLLEEASELAQAEGITAELAVKQLQHVYNRPAGDPRQEAAGVAVTLLGWCAAAGTKLANLAEEELTRIESKPIEQIRGSLARKQDADLVTCAEEFPANWVKCPMGEHLVFLRENGLVVAHHGSDGSRCPASEQMFSRAERNL